MKCIFTADKIIDNQLLYEFLKEADDQCLIHLISQAQFFINKMHQPCRTDKQKLKVFEKRRFLSFDFMTIKLEDPCDHKNQNADLP